MTIPSYPGQTWTSESLKISFLVELTRYDRIRKSRVEITTK